MKKLKFSTGNNIRAKESSWSFKGKVALNFDKHIKRSVPLYSFSQKIGLQISDFFLVNNSSYYDLGCSTGTFIKALANKHKSKKVKLYGIDIIKEMTQHAQKKNSSNKNVSIINQDIRKFKFLRSSFITSYYTIQFLNPHERQNIIDKVYKSLQFGGAFLFFEKIRAPEARFQDMLSLIYNDFKLSQGFKAEEIFNKAKSLKGVLEPFSSKMNLNMLKKAGFSQYLIIFKCLNFEGILAIK